MVNALTVWGIQTRAAILLELMARLQTSVDESQTVNSKFIGFDGRVGRLTVPNGTDEPDTFGSNPESVSVSLRIERRRMSTGRAGRSSTAGYSLFDTLHRLGDGGSRSLFGQSPGSGRLEAPVRPLFEVGRRRRQAVSAQAQLNVDARRLRRVRCKD